MDIIVGKNGNQPFPLIEASISRHHASFHLDEKSGKKIIFTGCQKVLGYTSCHMTVKGLCLMVKDFNTSPTTGL